MIKIQIMKKTILLVVILICGITNVQAQSFGSKKITGNGKISRENRTTNTYESISVLGNLDVELVRGEEGRLKIEAEGNLLEYIKTRVVNNKLTISIKKGYSLRPSLRKRIAITIPFEDIIEVRLSGSGDIHCTDPIKTNRFSTAVSGSGDIDIHVISKTVIADIAGSGDIKLYGKTDHFEVSIAGSGDVSAYELITNTAEISVAGSGDVRLFVNESLDASIAGSGDIHYKGKPVNVDKSIAGSGSVSKE